MKKLMMGIILFVTVAARADYGIYGGDIATKGVSVDKKQERILFGGRKGGAYTYTLSADTIIYSGGMPNAGEPGQMAGYVFDFTEGNHTLTLANGDLLVYQHHEDVLFRGGVWDFGGHPFSSTGKMRGAGYGYDNSVTLTNSCVMTNVSSFAGLHGSPNYRFRMTDGSVLKVDGNFNVFNNDDGSAAGIATNMLFEMSGGSYVSCKDVIFDAGSSNPNVDRGNIFRVTGTGTEFYSPSGSFMMGYGTRGNVFEVADHAKATIYFPRLGYHADTSETGFLVRDGATLQFDHDLEFGNDSNAAMGGIFLRASGGATVSVGPSGGRLPCLMRSANNELFVSNSTFSCSSLRIGALSGATGNVVRVSGSEAAFSVSSEMKPLFGFGSCNRFIVENGASFSTANLYTDIIGMSASSNTVAVRGGAEVAVTGTLKFGDSLSPNAIANRLEVLDGARLSIGGSLTMTATNNVVVVSNATLEVTRDTSASLDQSFAVIGSDSKKSSGCSLVVQGDSPRILIPKTSLRFDNNSTLRFDLPPNGYKDNLPPLEIQQIINYTMDYEINGLDELQKNLRKSTDIPLIKMSYRMWDGSSAFSAIARINEKLAETNPGCRLWKQDNRQAGNGETIFLHVKPISGLILLFR